MRISLVSFKFSGKLTLGSGAVTLSLCRNGIGARRSMAFIESDKGRERECDHRASGACKTSKKRRVAGKLRYKKKQLTSLSQERVMDK